jgi:hypothetical protein
MHRLLTSISLLMHSRIQLLIHFRLTGWLASSIRFGQPHLFDTMSSHYFPHFMKRFIHLYSHELKCNYYNPLWCDLTISYLSFGFPTCYCFVVKTEE